MKRIVSDVDGVWLNFIVHFFNHFDKKVPIITSWDNDYVHRHFSKIINNKRFWETLPSLSHACEVPDSFIITHYLSSFPEQMLDARAKNMQNESCPFAPIYYSEDKITWLQDRIDEWDVFIDDKASTIWEARKAFPGKHIIRFIPTYYVNEYEKELDDKYYVNKIGSISNFNQL